MMAIVEARLSDGSLIEIAEVSITETVRIMITDNAGHQVFLHRVAWIPIMREVSKLLIIEEEEKGKH